MCEFHCSINSAPFRNQNGWLKILALACTAVVIGLAKYDDAHSSYFNNLDEHEEWLIHSTAVGSAIFLTIIVVTYLLGDAQPLKTEAMFLLTYAALFLYSGANIIQYYQETDNDRGKAMGSMAICAGILMGADFISAFVQIVR